MSDSGIRSRLEQNLRAHRELDLRSVAIDVHLKVVTISGIAASNEERRTIQKIAIETAGVDQVVINLVVPE